ncbi:MAG TPA: hypothetical protein VKI44_31015 [Acetobacteraceae bacterium]|nr:hypothetical protein [Acetobacteraceae bacterium]
MSELLLQALACVGCFEQRPIKRLSLPTLSIKSLGVRHLGMYQLRAQSLDSCERVRKCSLGTRTRCLLSPQGGVCLRQLLCARRWVGTAITPGVQYDHRNFAVFNEPARPM